MLEFHLPMTGQTAASPGCASPLTTSLVGSYPQPEWLIDREALRKRLPPRVRALELWRVDPLWLREAQDDAVLLAVRDQERAGLSVVTDGEARRESYSNQFANALDRVDLERPGTIRSRAGKPASVPRVVAPIVRREPVHLEDVRFLRAHTDKPIKATLPGPFTMSQQAVDEFYADEEELALAYAGAVHEEIADLLAAGADIVQLDEPWLEARPQAAARYGLEVLRRALDGIQGTTAVHICFGYPAFVTDWPPGYTFLPRLADCPADQISIETAQPDLDLGLLDALAAAGKTVILGVIALDTPEVEAPDGVAARLRRALRHLPPERLVAAPDCGMKYLSRAAAYAKLQALVAGARLAHS